MRVKLLAHSPVSKLLESTDRLGSELPIDSFLPHTGFTFTIERISRACSHQLVRHRVASYSQQSQRYVEEKLGGHVVVPESIMENKERSANFEKLIEMAQSSYNELTSLGVPKEDARFVLPNATETNLLATFDGRSLLHFFGLRCCNRAQWEIRALADAMLKEVLRVEPELFLKAGPYCYQRGHCDEGRFSCGRMKEVLMKYEQMRREIRT